MMQFANFRFNYKTNVSDKFLVEPNQTLERVLDHASIEQLFMTPGDNCKKFFTEERVKRLIKYCTDDKKNQYPTIYGISSTKMPYIASKLLSSNSSIINNFFFVAEEGDEEAKGLEGKDKSPEAEDNFFDFEEVDFGEGDNIFGEDDPDTLDSAMKALDADKPVSGEPDMSDIVGEDEEQDENNKVNQAMIMHDEGSEKDEDDAGGADLGMILTGFGKDSPENVNAEKKSDGSAENDQLDQKELDEFQVLEEVIGQQEDDNGDESGAQDTSEPQTAPEEASEEIKENDSEPSPDQQDPAEEENNKEQKRPKRKPGMGFQFDDDESGKLSITKVISEIDSRSKNWNLRSSPTKDSNNSNSKNSGPNTSNQQDSSTDPFSPIKDLKTPKKETKPVKELKTENLDLLFSFLTRKGQENHTLASYFCKVVKTLIKYHPLEMMKYFNSSEFDQSRLFVNLRYQCVAELVSRILNFEKAMSFTEKQNEIAKSYTASRITAFVQLLDLMLADEDPRSVIPENIFGIVKDLLEKLEHVYDPIETLKKVLLNKEQIGKLVTGLKGSRPVRIACYKIFGCICDLLLREPDADSGISTFVQDEGEEVKKLICEALEEGGALRNAVGEVKRSVVASEFRVTTNSMGVEVTNFGVQNFEFLDFGLAMLKLKDEGLNKVVAESGFYEMSQTYFEEFPWKNIIGVTFMKIFRIIIDKEESSPLFNQLVEEMRLVQLLERCSRNDYIYPDCRTNKKIEAKIAEYERRKSELVEGEKMEIVKPQKVKTGNYGFLREIGNLVDNLPQVKKQHFIQSDLWVGFKERYLKPVNKLLSKEREDAFRRKEKRSSIYFNLDGADDDSSFLETLQKLGAFDPIANLKKKASAQSEIEEAKSQDSDWSNDSKLSRFSNYSLGDGDLKFKERTAIFSNFEEKGDQMISDGLDDIPDLVMHGEDNSDQSGSEEEEHMKLLEESGEVSGEDGFIEAQEGNEEEEKASEGPAFVLGGQDDGDLVEEEKFDFEKI